MPESETCVAFDLNSFINAFGPLNSIKTNENINNLSPQYSSQDSPPLALEQRKRRRGDVANPANTLDGLVARRSDDGLEPFQKRYLLEHEAIEGPDDEIELKRMERDPDVSSRTCSICGYQGKWVSEMIRHKRVHTSDRPFRCRFCSRTSKWKADLIRHVAKTHRIRVVSKYSRSKTFDPATTLTAERSDEDKPKVFACETDKEPERQKLEVPRRSQETHQSPLSYRCEICHFEQRGLSVMLAHVRGAHSLAPYGCRCGAAFETIDMALSHPKSVACDLLVQITPMYNQNRDEHASPTRSSHSLCSSHSPTSSQSSDSGLGTDDESATRGCFPCALCSFTSSSASEFESHTRRHMTGGDVTLPSHDVTLPTHDLIRPAPHQPINPAVYPELTSLLTPSPLNLTAALLALQSTMSPSFLSSINFLNAMTSSAFTPFAPMTQTPTTDEEVVNVEV